MAYSGFKFNLDLSEANMRIAAARNTKKENIMQESKSITARWAEAKQAVIHESDRLREIAREVRAAIKEECGQSVRNVELIIDEFAKVEFVDAWMVYRFNNNRWSATKYLESWRDSTLAAGEHWQLSLKQCEALAIAMQNVDAADLRLLFERAICD